jgi:hypothetical protein
MRVARLHESSVFDEDLVRFHLMPVSEVAKDLRARPEEAGAELEESLRRFFDSEHVVVESRRVAAVKMAIALLPRTGPLIRQVLMTFDRHELYPVHFSFLCYMDEVGSIDMSFGRGVPYLLRDYLSRVKLSKGHSAWTAAVLLGEHFPPDRGVELLEEVALNGSTAIGREMSVIGLGKALGRVSDGGRRHIEALVARVASGDKSKSVRAVAASVLKGVV